MFDPLTMDSAYVVLGSLQDSTSGFLSECVETWGSLLLQTLQEKNLSDWLDQTDNCPHPGQHPNIAVPLYQQRVGGIHIEDHSSQFGMLRYSKQTAKRDYFWDVVRAHHALRNPCDPRKRAAYWKQRPLASQAVHQHRVYILFYLTLVVILYKLWCRGYPFTASANGFLYEYVLPDKAETAWWMNRYVVSYVCHHRTREAIGNADKEQTARYTHDDVLEQ